jgi:hypothetical protein
MWKFNAIFFNEQKTKTTKDLHIFCANIVIDLHMQISGLENDGWKVGWI